MDTATGLAAIWLGFVAAMGLVSWAMSSTVGRASRKSERASHVQQGVSTRKGEQP